MNKKLVESPKSFQVACTVMTQIIAAIASGQYGGQSVEVRHLGKYLRRSYEKFKKELREEVGNKLSNDLIEKIVSSSTDIIVNADEGLENYKTLIEELIKEIKSEDFQKALQEVNKYKSEKEDSKEKNE